MAVNISQQLIAYRKANKLTQEDVAALMDTTQQTVANWERGTMPRPMALVGILAMLETGEAPSPPPREQQGTISPIQAAFLSKAQELVSAGKLDDSVCVELLASWKKLF